MDEQVPYTPSTVEEVFKDFKGRRAAMVKALTTDVEQFYRECDPDKENLCLYGFPDENWDVSLPAEEVPPELPEPALGINFARDGMDRKDWLSLVAVHSDAWLLAVAFYYGARLDKLERKRLFDMVNELPTVFDAVTARGKVLKEKQSSVRAKKVKENSSNKPSKRATLKKEEEDDYEDEEDEEHGDTFCGSCAEPYSDSQFWIACDVCQKWYHGACVKMNAAKAANVEEYKCPSCSNKKARV